MSMACCCLSLKKKASDMTLTATESKRNIQEGTYAAWKQGKKIVEDRNKQGKMQFVMTGMVTFQEGVPSYSLGICSKDHPLQSGEFLLETEEDVQKMFMCFATFRPEASVND